MRQGLNEFSGARMMIFTFVLAMLPFCASADDENEGGRKVTVQALPATGPNRMCNKPLFLLPDPFPPTTGFTFLGEYDPTPGATDAISLDESNCVPDTILASTTNLDFQAFFGFPDADQRLKNIPLRDIPVLAGLDGSRASLPAQGDLPANPLPPVRSKPDYPITLGGWSSVEGSLKLQCRSDGTAKVKAELRSLIPNGVYTLFGIWKTRAPGTGNITFMPVAFGGFPNVFVANEKGKGKFKRDLDYCPLDPTPDGSVLMFVDLAYHADSNPHGGFPFTPLGTSTFIDKNGEVFQSTRPAGIVTFVQAAFPVTVEPLP